jgi:hypothetical protein
VGILLHGHSGTYGRETTFIPSDLVPPSIGILNDLDAVVFPFLTNRGLLDTALRAGNPDLNYLAAQALGTPNTHLLHGMRSMTMFDHIQPQRLDALLALLGSEYSHTLGQAAPVEELQRGLTERWNVLERIGVSHVLTPVPLPDRRELLSSLLFPEVLAQDESGNTVTLEESVSLYVYEVPLARRHLSAAGAVATQPPDGDAARERILGDASGGRTVIECTDCPETDPTGRLQLSLLERTPTRTRARVQGTTPRWIVLQRQLLPGWRARVDGEAVRPAIADGLLIAVPVPAGEHEVDVSFSWAGMLRDAAALLLAPKRTPWFS